MAKTLEVCKECGGKLYNDFETLSRKCLTPDCNSKFRHDHRTAVNKDHLKIGGTHDQVVSDHEYKDLINSDDERVMVQGLEDELAKIFDRHNSTSTEMVGHISALIDARIELSRKQLEVINSIPTMNPVFVGLDMAEGEDQSLNFSTDYSSALKDKAERLICDSGPIEDSSKLEAFVFELIDTIANHNKKGIIDRQPFNFNPMDK